MKPGVYRCHLSLPSGLVIKTSSIPKAGAGAWAEAPVPKGVRFGPYEGIIVEHSEDAHSGYCWQVRLLECRSKEGSGHIWPQHSVDNQRGKIVVCYFGIHNNTFEHFPNSIVSMKPIHHWCFACYMVSMDTTV